MLSTEHIALMIRFSSKGRKTLLITFDKLILHLITCSRDIHGFHPEEFVKAHADLHEGLRQRGQFLQSLPIPSLLKVKQSDFKRKNNQRMLTYTFVYMS